MFSFFIGFRKGVIRTKLIMFFELRKVLRPILTLKFRYIRNLLILKSEIPIPNHRLGIGISYRKTPLCYSHSIVAGGLEEMS